MKKHHIEALESELRKMGFPGKWGLQLKLHMATNPIEFTIKPKLTFNKDKMDYGVHFERKNEQAGEYIISRFEAMLQKEKLIPHFTINGVDTAELERRISKIKWQNDYFNETPNDRGHPDESNRRLDDEVIRILRDTSRLAENNSTGEFIRVLLYQKYWEDTPFAEVFPAGIRLKNPYDARQVFYNEDEFKISAREAYNLLRGRAIHKENSRGKQPSPGAWYKLNMSQKDADGNNLFEQIPGSEKFFLKERLDAILPKQIRSEEMIGPLIEVFREGSIAELIIADDRKKEEKFLLTAAPEKNVIVLEFPDTIFLGKALTLSLNLYGQTVQQVQLGENQGTILAGNPQLEMTREHLLSKEQNPGQTDPGKEQPGENENRGNSKRRGRN